MKDFNRWSNFTFKNGLTTRNRVVVPPMASSTANTSGFVTDKTLEHYERLGESGAGILFVEYSYVHPSGRGEEKQLGIDRDEQIPGLKKLAQVIQKSGALAGIQLVHNGGKASSRLTGGPLWGPSPIPVPVKDQEMETPHEMSIDEIHLYQQWYVDAVRRASEAGFQILQFHAAHGYGLNQWLSPMTNQRKDIYGGSLENRSRMLSEILSQTRNILPEALLGFRIPGADNYPGGLTAEEMISVSKRLVHSGVDFLDVSSGIGGWRRPAHHSGEGYLVSESARIQAQVQVPVIGVGGIKTGPFIDQSLTNRHLSFAAVGRAILDNPREFYQNVLQRDGLWTRAAADWQKS